jgi:hypothetical protein
MKQPFPEVTANVCSPRSPNSLPEPINKETLDLDMPNKVSGASVPAPVPDSLPLAAPTFEKEVHGTVDSERALGGSHRHPSQVPPEDDTQLIPQQSSLISQHKLTIHNSNTGATKHKDLQHVKAQHDQRVGNSSNNRNGVSTRDSNSHNSNALPKQSLQRSLQQPADGKLHQRKNASHPTAKHREQESQQVPESAEIQQQPQTMSLDEKAIISDAQLPQIDDHISNNDRQVAAHPESRPQSRRGNRTIRPFPEDEIRLSSASDSTTLHANHSAKVRKSKTGQQSQASVSAKSSPSPLVDSQQRHNISKSASKYLEFLSSGQDFVDTLNEYEKQKDVIESQKAEIEKLQGCGTEFKSKIKSLEEDKQALAKKIKKFTSLCEKYKTHMNEVVNAQKELLVEAKTIRTETEAVRQDAKEFTGDIQQIRADSQAHLQKHATATKDVVNQLKVTIQEYNDIKNQLVNSELPPTLPVFNTYFA